MKSKYSRKKAKRRQVPLCCFHISSSFNNTIISLTDTKGNVLMQQSGGKERRFKGAKKSTAIAAKMAADTLIKRAQNIYSFKEAIVLFKGVGMGKDAAIKALGDNEIKIVNIANNTRFPYNGCKLPKNSRLKNK